MQNTTVNTLGMYNAILHTTHTHTNKHTHTGVPTVKLLACFPSLVGGVSKNINIIQRTSPSYTKLRKYLLDDDNYDILDDCKKYHHDPEEIVTSIYKKWISGTGRKPVTWQTLVGVLRDIELNSLADTIEHSCTLNYPTRLAIRSDGKIILLYNHLTIM